MAGIYLEFDLRLGYPQDGFRYGGRRNISIRRARWIRLKKLETETSSCTELLDQATLDRPTNLLENIY